MTSQKPKELSKLINKIIKARKIQKDRIENENLEGELEAEHIQRKQKPFIEAVKKVDENLIKTNQNTIAAIENQQQNVQYLQDMLKHSTKEITSKLPKPKDSKSWVQYFYQDYKTGAKLTMLEAKMNGLIGEFGYIDIPYLFNNGEVRMSLGPKYEPFKVIKKNVTKGLIGLLLLPYDDMVDARILPTQKDTDIYKAIMSKAGCRASIRNRKYQKYLKGIQQIDPDLDELSLLQRINELNTREELDRKAAKVYGKVDTFEEDIGEDEVFGKGLLLYKDPSDLEDKLKICLGSLQAGNTSLKVKNDCRILLDKLLELKEILPSIHNRLYRKFQL